MVKRLEFQESLVGYKQVKRAVEDGIVDLVYLALDTDKDMQDEIRALCKENNIELLEIESKEELGEKSGIDISAAVAALINKNI